MTIWIEDIAQAFEETDQSWQPYLDSQTGEILFVPLQENDLEQYSQEEKEEFMEIASMSRYICMPNQKELKEFDIMEQYANDTYNVGLKKRLLFALNKPKPFRNFRAQIRLLGLEEDYTHYRYMIFCSMARNWCKQRALVFEVEDEEVKDYFAQIEEDERIEKDLDDFNEELDEFEYEEDYEDYFDED